MSRWSARRGAVDPLAALAAVLAVTTALTIYAVGLDATLDSVVVAERSPAEPTLDRVCDRLLENGIVDPPRLPAATDAPPDGYRIRVALTVGGETRTVGPDPPPGADAATRPVSVRQSPGQVGPGRLRVEVWT